MKQIKASLYEMALAEVLLKQLADLPANPPRGLLLEGGAVHVILPC